MSYIDFLNAFNDWIEEDNPTDKVVILYYGLLNTFNRRRWPEWAGVDTQRLMVLARTTDKKSALKARDALVKAGLIEYRRGKKGKATTYRLLKYGGKILPKNTTKNATENATESAPPIQEKEKDVKKDFSVGGGDRAGAREEAENEVGVYMQDRQLDPFSTFGATEEVVGEAARFADAIFKKFTRRQPTEADIASVFERIRHQEHDDVAGAWKITLMPERKNLLMYAFEQAALSGKPGDWKYINGILANMHRRGITSLDAAEDYDIERDERA